MSKVSKFTFAFACLALVASNASASTVTYTQSTQGGFQVLDFFYSSDQGEEFIGWELDVTCVVGGNCISDPNRGANSATTQWDNIAGGPRLDTWMNTVYSHLYDSGPTYVFNNYKPSAPGQSPIPTSRLYWTAFDTDTGDTNDIDPGLGVAPYHLGRVLTAPGSSGTIVGASSDSVGAPVPFSFSFGAVGVAPNINNVLIDNVNSSVPGTVGGTITQTGGTDPIVWSGGTLTSFTPTHGAPVAQGNAEAANFVFNPATQQFSWDTVGAPRGIYIFGVSATNAAGSDPGSIQVNVTAVPEPATFALVGLGLVGLVGIGRRRS